MDSQSVCRKATQDLTDADFMDSTFKQEDPTSTKRLHPRRPAKWLVIVKTTQGKLLEGKTVNVSKEGMMISLSQNLKLGCKAFIEASVLYRGTLLNLQGVTTVRHSSLSGRQFNIGFQFTAATETTTRFLDQYAANTI